MRRNCHSSWLTHPRRRRHLLIGQSANRFFLFSRLTEDFDVGEYHDNDRDPEGYGGRDNAVDFVHFKRTLIRVTFKLLSLLQGGVPKYRQRPGRVYVIELLIYSFYIKK